ncbi:MAG: hypothetical protein KBA95_10235 [Acidobacteria bacterium]|nr:hypothetical protein [Acidobacteriota bacterium]
MRFGLRSLVYIGVFGALWGGLEATLGAALHALGIPFAGLLLASAGMTIALIGRLFVPRAGSLLAIGVVTALLKAFSVGGLVFSPMLAIVVESAIAEAVVLAAGIRRAGFVAAGAVALVWPVVHPLITQTLIAGRGVLAVYLEMVRGLMRWLGLEAGALAAALAVFLVLHLSAGALAGWLAWEAGQSAARRTGRVESA